MIVKAVYDFKGDKESKQISFLRHELLHLTERCKNGWAKGFKLSDDRTVGYFPIKYVKEKPLDEEEESAAMLVYLVKYKYAAKKFQVAVNEHLISMASPQNGWIYCERLSNGTRGYVPEKYVSRDSTYRATGVCRSAFSKGVPKFLDVKQDQEVELLREINSNFTYCRDGSGQKVKSRSLGRYLLTLL